MSHVDLSLIPSVVHMQHTMADTVPTRKKTEPMAYYRIASHYKFVMGQMFDCWQYPKLIVLEVHDSAPRGNRLHYCTSSPAGLKMQKPECLLLHAVNDLMSDPLVSADSAI